MCWKISVQHDTMKSRGGAGVLQAKKRDHKIMITGVAIDKVSFLEIPRFSEEQNANLRQLHQDLLKEAQTRNNSNEVAYATSMDFRNQVAAYGSEHFVDLRIHTEIASLKKRLYAHELIIAHNHPSTASFSFADIAAFIFDEYIGMMTVVTNQGDVYALQKGERFDYTEAKKLFSELVKKYCLMERGTEGNQAEAAKEFLKTCGKVGAWYGKGT